MSSVLIKRGHLDIKTDTRIVGGTLCKSEGRSQGDVSAKYQKLGGKNGTDFPSQSSDETNPLISDF